MLYSVCCDRSSLSKLGSVNVVCDHIPVISFSRNAPTRASDNKVFSANLSNHAWCDPIRSRLMTNLLSGTPRTPRQKPRSLIGWPNVRSWCPGDCKSRTGASAQFSDASFRRYQHRHGSGLPTVHIPGVRRMSESSMSNSIAPGGLSSRLVVVFLGPNAALGPVAINGGIVRETVVA